MYQREISHEGLRCHHVIRAEVSDVADALAEMRIRKWDERWARQKAIQKERTDRFLKAIKVDADRNGHHGGTTIDIEVLKSLADDCTSEYREAIEALEHLLLDSLEDDHSLDWSHLLGDYPYASGVRPKPQDGEGKREARKHAWPETIEGWRRSYFAGDPRSISDYCRSVLASSEYPDSFPHDVVLYYVIASRTLAVDYRLPGISALPRVKGTKVIASRGVIEDVNVSDEWLHRTYDSVLYQVALRSLYELFQADDAGAIDSIVFNGWVKSIDKATGKEVAACILSVHAGRREFMDMNLANVDPKMCFKKLKGVSAAKLVALQPVRPILQMNRDDKQLSWRTG